MAFSCQSLILRQNKQKSELTKKGPLKRHNDHRVINHTFTHNKYNDNNTCYTSNNMIRNTQSWHLFLYPCLVQVLNSCIQSRCTNHYTITCMWCFVEPVWMWHCICRPCLKKQPINLLRLWKIAWSKNNSWYSHFSVR